MKQTESVASQTRAAHVVAGAWRRTAFECQAKYLITEKNWSSQQVTALWNLEDGCGDRGHEHS